VIAATQQLRVSSALARATSVVLVGCFSLFVAVATIKFQYFAVANAIFLVLIALALWRPRYGIYAVVLVAISFAPTEDDALMRFGWYMQNPISATSNVSMLFCSPLELILLITIARVLVAALIERTPLARAQLQKPLLVFLGLLLISVGFGMATGGLFNIALWETRCMVAGVIVALLVPNVIRERSQVHHLINLLCVSVVLLSANVVWRRFTVLADEAYLDLAFDHDTPIFMNFVVLLLIARLVWPASGRQRLAALLIPFILYAQMVTERRAGWVSLDLGLVLIAIFVFRLRRKVFYFLVLPLMVLYIGYLGAFWNASGPIAQPARAIRSINDPEGRDQGSNIYRMVERENIRLNVRAHPATGLGFGKEYAFYLSMPDLSWWPFWHYIAHTQLMWLWMKMGPLGFIAFLTVCGAGTTRGVQLLKSASNSRSAPYLVAIVSALPMLLVYSYVDLALSSIRVMALMGFVLGVIGMWGLQATTTPRDETV
jgi:hypothetical protein